MPHHEGEADLLAGGLYLQLGMHNEAGRRFETLLGDDIPASVRRQRAWFYLAKVWYARGYFDRSVESLQRIEGALPPVLGSGEACISGANALMQLRALRRGHRSCCATGAATVPGCSSRASISALRCCAATGSPTVRRSSMRWARSTVDERRTAGTAGQGQSGARVCLPAEQAAGGIASPISNGCASRARSPVAPCWVSAGRNADSGSVRGCAHAVARTA